MTLTIPKGVSVDEKTLHDEGGEMASVTRVSSFPVGDDGGGTDDGEDDAAVIERSWREPDAFSAVFDRYHREIHGYAARRLGRDLADDVAAETFLVAFDRRERYDVARPDARPWLYGIASNLISRRRRAEVRQYRALARTGVDDMTDGHADQVTGRVDAQAVRPRLAAALAKLAARDRDVLLLVAWAQLSCEEAAQALGVPSGTARSRLHRARTKVRATLDGKDD